MAGREGTRRPDGSRGREAVCARIPADEEPGPLNPSRAASLALPVLLLAALPGCRAPEPEPESDGRGTDPAGSSARRIVSLDYCADQYLLRLADRERILAVSPDAGASFSYMREAAVGIPRVVPAAESVLALDPDLIIRSYGGGAGAASFYRRVGIPVVQVGFGADLAGVRRVIGETADALGVPERGGAVLEEMDARLGAIGSADGSGSALYLTPGGVTAGPGTLVHELLTAAGYRNFQHEPGYREIPLERLAYESPDLIAAAFYRAVEAHRGSWSASRHPVARAQLDEGPVVFLDGAWTACGGWFVLDAIEALAGAGSPRDAHRASPGTAAPPEDAAAEHLSPPGGPASLR